MIPTKDMTPAQQETVYERGRAERGSKIHAVRPGTRQPGRKALTFCGETVKLAGGRFNPFNRDACQRCAASIKPQ